MTTEEFKNTVIPFSRKLYPMLFRILKNEEETRDALQDLMVKLWDKRNDLAQCNNQTAYIITMSKNHSLVLLKNKRPSRIGKNEEHKIQNLANDDNGQDAKEKFEHVRSAIEALPEKYRNVIMLRDIDGFEFDEISEMTGYEVPYIRVILSRARQKVKEEVEKKYDYDQSGKFVRQIL